MEREPDPRSQLTPAAQRVMDRAEEEARRFNHNYLGTEHVLLGLIYGEETTASRVLADLGVEAFKVRNAVEFIVGRGDRAPIGYLGLTPRTRTVLAFAIAEAKQLGQKLASPEHLLLGLIREGEGIAAGVLESLGVSLPRTRRQTLVALGLPPNADALGLMPERQPHASAPPAGPAGPARSRTRERRERSAMQNDRFDKFSQRARQVLALAQEEAQRFNHNYIGTEHLLLGLVREGDGVAAKVLTNMGVDLTKVRSAIEFIIGRGNRAPVGEIGLTPRARKVIELAVDEARSLRHHYIGTEHLLLGLVREGEGVAAGVLGSLGVNLEKVRQQTLMVLSQSAKSGAAADVQERGLVEHTASASQTFELGALRRVLPLAQTEEHDAVAVTALSLEDYEHGFRLILRVLGCEPGQPLPPSFQLPFVRPGLGASDDRGGRYRVVRGNSRSDVGEQRIELEFASGLNPAARELRLQAAERPEPGAPNLPPVEASESGMWELTFTLPA